jgi:cyclic lactone autoinducer peptide
MNIRKARKKISEVLCNSALGIAKKSVEQEGKIPLCTIIIHQPAVPDKLKNFRQ